MTSIALVFPHQLYEKSAAWQTVETVYLVEDSLFFNQYNFHQQKLVLHRASMQFYESYLQTLGKKTVYVDYQQSLQNCFANWQSQGIQVIHYTNTTDYLLERRLKRWATQYQIRLVCYENPNFLTTKNEVEELLKQDKNYFFTSFYIKQRKNLQILLEPDGTPQGGKWSFDTENRKKIPNALVLPHTQIIAENKWVKEAKEYVKQHFGNNYGKLETFNYPTTFEEAQAVLDHFLRTKLAYFGDYEDAICQRQTFLFHSVLTPALNIGLLSPEQVIKKTLDFTQTHNIPLNSLEGFIRQVIGWREFIRGVYELEGVRQRTTNFWGYTQPVPKSFWNGNTQLLPFDTLIRKLEHHAYTHHIERLMIAGSLFQLCEFSPNSVYQWFMEWYIDAYDWVMVPNVYGMTLYADGGLITTKPYLSGSNYLLKMSDFSKGAWCSVWDGLYWRYIWKHQDVLAKNIRMSLPINLVKKMDKQVLQKHLQIAEDFLAKVS
jgi:deoxyribodipyrimidine photolyase-related protein